MGKLVHVTWDDAWGAMEDDGTDALRVETVGWVVRQNKRSLVLAAERLPDGTWRGVTRIPRACVLRVRKIR